jgi:hypothetical protein
MPLFFKGMISEFMIVAMVIRPPPPRPASPRMRSRKMMLGDIPQPRQPRRKAMVAVKKHARRPRISENLP